jgi:hypothetical protein
MKRGTTDHPKTLALMRALKIPKYAAVGMLECLWHFCARYAPQGNVGKYSDQEIADSTGWTGDASKLMESLFVCRWLDKSGQWRYCIHDWQDHLEDATAKWLKRNQLEPIAGDATATATATATAIAIAIAKGDADMSRNVAKCPDNTLPELPFSSEAFKTTWASWEQHRVEKKHKLTPSTRAAQLRKMEKWGEAAAIAAIERSIEKGWTGLFSADSENTASQNAQNEIPWLPATEEDRKRLAEGSDNA